MTEKPEKTEKTEKTPKKRKMTLRTAQKEALKAKPKSRLTAPEMKAL